MSTSTSYGMCMLCGKHTTKAAMSRHLAQCAAAHDAARGKPERLLRVRIEDAHSPLYWMDVEIKANAMLTELDDYLRLWWLDCCGHLSSFSINEKEYSVPEGVEELGEFDAQRMAIQVKDVLRVGSEFSHIYDFGSSTELKLHVPDEREGRISKEPLRHLSNNDAPAWTCEVCGGPAQWLCSFCAYEKDNPFYCQTHAEDHDCDEPEMLMPVVNSPRMGVCAYGVV